MWASTSMATPYIIKITSSGLRESAGYSRGRYHLDSKRSDSSISRQNDGNSYTLSALDYCLVAAFAAGSILGYLDSQLFMKITNQFLPAGFVGDSHSFCIPQATQKCLWVYCSALAAKPKVLTPQDIRYSPINITIYFLTLMENECPVPRTLHIESIPPRGHSPSPRPA